jgi:hypothetical protein
MHSLLSLQNICFNYSSSKCIFYPLRGVQNENRKSSSLEEQHFVNRKAGPPIASLDITLKKKKPPSASRQERNKGRSKEIKERERERESHTQDDR